MQNDMHWITGIEKEH